MTPAPGRPRSAEADRVIREAALELFATHGLDGLSVDAVAERAGVSKATIYRRFACKADMVVAALEAAIEEKAAVPDTGNVRDDLRLSLSRVAELVTTGTLGAAVRTLVGVVDRHEELRAAHAGLVAARRRNVLAIFERGVARGELRRDLDPDLVADLTVGPLFFRVLVSGGPVDEPFLDGVVDAVLRAFAP